MVALFLKGMAGALAPFSYLVSNNKCLKQAQNKAVRLTKQEYQQVKQAYKVLVPAGLFCANYYHLFFHLRTVC
jgi:hypothetical protein